MDYNSILQKWINYIDALNLFCALYCTEEDFLTNKNLNEYKNLIEYCNSNLNNSDCLYFIGFSSFLNGRYLNSIELHNKAICLYNSKAMFFLALMYQYGIGIEKNYDKSIELYNKAICLGNSRAMVGLAIMYQYGIGIEKNYNKSIELYNKAICIGNLNAMVYLAILYQHNKEFEKNFEKSIELHNKAINLGSYEAIVSLAYIYEYGEGTKKRYNKAIELYNKADKQRSTSSNKNKIKNIYSNNIDYFIKKHIKLVKKCKDIKVKIENKKNYISQLENLPFGKEYYKTLDHFNKMVNKN